MRYRTLMVSKYDVRDALNAQDHMAQMWPERERKVALFVMDGLAKVMGIDIITTKSRAVVVDRDGAEWAH